MIDRHSILLIEQILERGNDVEIQNRKDGFVIIEAKKKIYRPHKELEAKVQGEP